MFEADRFFKWQRSYGAFTVGRRNLDQAADYIRNQRMPHHQQSVNPAEEFVYRAQLSKRLKSR
jgi:hypothetical protein